MTACVCWQSLMLRVMPMRYDCRCQRLSLGGGGGGGGHRATVRCSPYGARPLRLQSLSRSWLLMAKLPLGILMRGIVKRIPVRSPQPRGMRSEV